MYSIYKIKSYNTRRENYKKITYDIDKICDKLETDKSYHLIYTKNDNLIFFLILITFMMKIYLIILLTVYVIILILKTRKD